MKKIVAILITLTMLAALLPASLAEEAGYIAAPYAIDAELAGPTEYLEPVFYENADGPTIGVTLVGVIQQDGLYFKDSDNDQELDTFEDWRLSVEERVADLVPKMTTEQRIGLLMNQLVCSPTATTGADCYNEDGTVNFAALMTIIENPFAAVATADDADDSGSMEAYMAAISGGSDRVNSTGEMLANENRSGVVRVTNDVESGALWNNATNMVAEYAAVAKSEPTIPFYIISNPQNGLINQPSSTMGFAAAVMGDVANGGDFSLIERYADLDRQLWYARGIDGMYGPQIDLITDPRWPRNNTTFTEVPEINAGITEALVRGYQDGTDGDSVSLTIKHFPGDSPAVNGFESHSKYGEWRAYPTEGSLEKYHLVAFQAGIDAGVTGIMPCYSRPNNTLSVTQTYKGVEITPEEIGSAYNKTILQTLLKDIMGFKGYVNSDSSIINTEFWGAEEMTVPERYAAVINAGADVIGDGFAGIDYVSLNEAYNDGLIEEAAFDRATTDRVSIMLKQGQFENPYRDPKSTVMTDLADELAAVGDELQHKSVVLMKNHEDALPLTDASKKIYIQSFTASGENDDTVAAFAAAFEAAGFSIVDDEEDCDIAFLDVVPGGIAQSTPYMGVLDLVDGLDVPEYDPNVPITEAKTGDEAEVVTLQDVKKIAKVADAVHEKGGIVIASINISSPWILTNLEPYCDALIGSFGTSVAARVDVLTGAFAPTGKLPVTMVSCNEVIAVSETEIDGATYEICASPNDVPGYDKDQYIAEDVLAQSPSGSYAYQDADGNVYVSNFGLSY